MTLLAQFATTGGASPAYIEDVFSTWLFTANGANRSIVNGIDLAGKGGMVWLKNRSAAQNGTITDTARGVSRPLFPNLDNNSGSPPTSGGVSAFNADGFSILAGENSNFTVGNQSVSWTFRDQPNFFDVVTWTGTGVNRTVSHALGSVPGCIWVKRTDASGNWQVYHRDLANTQYMVLNTTDAAATGATRWNSTDPTATQFSLGTDATVNASGGTYVAYLFAHNAGGFGLNGTDSVVSCGSYTGNTASGVTVTVGFEPQWLLVKNTGAGNGAWVIMDNMRTSLTVNATSNQDLYANSNAAEQSPATATHPIPTATGFRIGAGTEGEFNLNSTQFIYIAIRRGPMRVPTSGLNVFTAQTGRSSGTPSYTSGFPVDFTMVKADIGGDWNQVTRLQGNQRYLYSNEPNAENFDSDVNQYAMDIMNGIGRDKTVYTPNDAWMFRRAPSYMDIVCYTGTGSNVSIAHNLQAVPQMAIIKRRSGIAGWVVGCPLLSNTAYGFLNDTAAFITSGGNAYFQNTAWSNQFLYLQTDQDVNDSGSTYIAYLFATAPGVSKVGTYTGTANTQQINCGFTTGARFVMIKRTNSTGDWYVWDYARGIVAGNDPYALLNSSAADVTSTDYVDTFSAGFELSATAPAALNASGGTYIFWAIA